MPEKRLLYDYPFFHPVLMTTPWTSCDYGAKGLVCCNEAVNYVSFSFFEEIKRRSSDSK